MSRAATILDWGTRVALFVLAAVATLAIVGAIVAIPGDVARTLAGLERMRDARTAEPSETREIPERRDEDGDGSPASTTMMVGRGDTGETRMVSGEATAAPDERIAGWLEVIAYALIANAALFALFGTALLRRR